MKKYVISESCSCYGEPIKIETLEHWELYAIETPNMNYLLVETKNEPSKVFKAYSEWFDIKNQSNITDYETYFEEKRKSKENFQSLVSNYHYL